MRNGVVGIVFNNDRNAVLLLKRRDVPMWVFPGGGIEEEESPEKAIVREVFEETGLTVGNLRKFGEYWPISHLASYTYAFQCKDIQGNLVNSDESCEVKFFPIEKLPSDFFHIHREWLEDCLTNSSELIKRQINVTYWRLFLYFLRHPIIVIRAISARLGFPINTGKN